MEYGMDVVLEAGPARILERREAAADPLGALQAQGLETRPAEVSLQDQAVMPRPQDDAVVRGQNGDLISGILIDLLRNSFV
jgi:hypothetical protein